ncbi:hypothetical protein ACIG0D_26170 [Streptomyces sp. NPDC052773]|uniref:baeRF2 domain-containing protein n=1 Tax=Streptomyces sp. NPDC052773 TaxID=3365693 RepID=UPI0037D53C65
MKLSFLDPLFATPGPWASVYLDTTRNGDDPDGAVAARWRHQRDALLAQGADIATVTALEEAVGTSDAPGQALFAAHGRLALAADLPDPPERDHARFDPLPDALPLALRRAPDIPYAAITITRWEPPAEEPPFDGPDTLHAPESSHATEAHDAIDGHDAYGGLDDLDGYDGYDGYGGSDNYDDFEDYDSHEGDFPGVAPPADAPHILLTCETGHWPTGRVHPGPRLTRRVPVAEWQRTAPLLARELTDLADRHAAEVVLVCRDAGDPWLSGVLVNRLPIHLQNRLTTVDEEPGTLGPGTPHPHLARLLRGRLRSADQHQLDTFFAQRARHRPKSEGVTAAVTALQRRQARSLLLTDALRLPERLWSGADPTQIALSAAELEAYGTPSVHEEPAGAALLAAAVRTGAELIVPPSDRVPLTDGIGVVLRYRDAADMAMTA